MKSANIKCNYVKILPILIYITVVFYDFKVYADTNSNFLHTKQIRVSDKELTCLIYATAGIEIIKQAAKDIHNFGETNVYKRIRSTIVASTIVKKGFEGINIDRCPSNYISIFNQVLYVYSEIIEKYKNMIGSQHILFSPVSIGKKIFLNPIDERNELPYHHIHSATLEEIEQQINLDRELNREIRVAHKNLNRITERYFETIGERPKMRNEAKQVFELFKGYKRLNMKDRKIANDFLWSDNKFNFPDGMNKAFDLLYK